jgi:hypothetical protein
MTPAKIENKSQEEVLLLLRAAIDTAIKSPTETNVNAAITMANKYPRALSGGKLRHNLGKRRWDWLGEYGITPASYGVIEPDITT